MHIHSHTHAAQRSAHAHTYSYPKCGQEIEKNEQNVNRNSCNGRKKEMQCHEEWDVNEKLAERKGEGESEIVSI